jgi:hypothetical protein
LSRSCVPKRERDRSSWQAGLSRRQIANRFEISQQWLWVILLRLPPAELEAAEAEGRLPALRHVGCAVRSGHAAPGLLGSLDR